MDVTEIERLWILGLEDKKGGDEITLVKDDTPEEDVSMEWMEEQEEEDSESCTTERKKKHRNFTFWMCARCHSRGRSWESRRCVQNLSDLHFFQPGRGIQHL